MSRMSEYSSRKASRKQRKSTNILFKETGIRCSNEPTKNLMIGNAGLVTGLQQECLLELCLPYGVVDNIVMIPGKSYCFVAFQDSIGASQAYDALHGKVKLTPSNSGPLYLAYAEQIPETGTVWDYNEKPPGLTVIEEFITELEEKTLLDCVDWSVTEPHSGQSLKHRRVKHYGYEFQYGINNVDKGCPLQQKVPSECCLVFDRLREVDSNLITSDPDQLTVNQYQPGQGIPPHIDTHSAFDGALLSLSLGSSIVMDFKHKDGRTIPVLLPQRSLLIMTGEARYAWIHGITPRKSDVIPASDGGLTVQKRGTRTSFTFRWVRKGECDCTHHTECDSYQRLKKGSSDIKSEELAAKLELLHVHKVYEEIASHFSETRHKPWPNVLAFVQNLTPGSVLVDVGCGNGKYFGHKANVFEIGCDRSCSLATVCKERGFQIFNCDCLSLPLRDGTADGCLSIAVIHHLATKERRLRALEEMIRILNPGGKALVYVWAKDQERQKKKSSYLKQDRKNRKTSTLSEESTLTKEVTNKCDTFHSDGHRGESVNNKNTVNAIPISVLVESKTDIDSNTIDSESRLIKELGKNGSQGDKSSIDMREDNLPALPLHTNRTQFQHQDVLVPWKLKQGKQTEAAQSSGVEVPTFYRYYHVFEEGELEQLCTSLKDAQIIKSYYDQGNWCIILQKIVDTLCTRY